MKYTGNYLNFKDFRSVIAIIGSRQASKEECEDAFKLAYKLSKEGYLILSGLALGIDSYAHMGALAADKPTVAVVNTSPNENIYPEENEYLAKDIRKHGMIIHPFINKATDYTSKPNQFVKRLIERDALQAAFSKIIVVTKKDPEPITGGTKWAVNYSYLFNRKVYRFDGEKAHNNFKFQRAKIWWEPESEYLKKLLKEVNQWG